MRVYLAFCGQVIPGVIICEVLGDTPLVSWLEDKKLEAGIGYLSSFFNFEHDTLEEAVEAGDSPRHCGSMVRWYIMVLDGQILSRVWH